MSDAEPFLVDQILLFYYKPLNIYVTICKQNSGKHVAIRVKHLNVYGYKINP